MITNNPCVIKTRKSLRNFIMISSKNASIFTLNAFVSIGWFPSQSGSKLTIMWKNCFRMTDQGGNWTFWRHDQTRIFIVIYYGCLVLGIIFFKRFNPQTILQIKYMETLKNLVTKTEKIIFLVHFSQLLYSCKLFLTLNSVCFWYHVGQKWAVVFLAAPFGSWDSLVFLLS